MTLRTSIFVAVAAMAMAACGDSDGNGGGGDDALCQLSFDDSNTAAIVPYEEVADEVWEERTLDFATCPAAPDPNGTCTFPIQIEDFQDGDFKAYLAGATVRVFLGNTIADLNATCADPSSTDPGVVCFEGDVDGTGYLEFPNIPCDSDVAVWAHQLGGMSPVTKAAAEFNHRVTAGMGTRKVLTISMATYGLIPGVVGFAPNVELGIVAGKARDCADNGISNIHTQIDAGHVDAPTTADFCGDIPIFGAGTFYFVNNFPNKNQTSTSEDGIWAFANVPAGEVTVFAFGRRAEDGAHDQPIGTAQVWAFPDTITISDLMIDAP